MTVYIFNEKEGKIKRYAHEVNETKALYRAKIECFETFFNSQLNKNEVGVLRDVGYWGISMLSTDGNLQEFIDKITELKKNRLARTEEKYLQAKEAFDRLKNGNYAYEEIGE